MEAKTGNQAGVLASLDYWTIAIYVALLVFGWMSVCGASYSFSEPDILSLSTRSGMQLVWIGTSICLGFVLLMLDDKYYDTFAYVLYAFFVLLLFATIFNPVTIKGSRSWRVLGSLRVQPAEFAKFATALAISKFMSSYGYNIHRLRDFALSCAIILVPMACIVLQSETGSALVYLAFFLMFYREGMPGSILFTGVAMVLYFVVGIRYEQVTLWDTPTSLGKFVVLLLIHLFSVGLVYVYCEDKQKAGRLAGIVLGVTMVFLLFSEYVIPFDIVWVQLILCATLIGYYLYQGLSTRVSNFLYVAMFTLGSIIFFYSASIVLNDVMAEYQQNRIKVVLGMTEDVSDLGYNVHQSEIAIGSGGLRGKGFLNGTQTKLKFVPEQDTDFIFCTVGEEEGFIGSSAVLLLFLALILRLIVLAERQPFKFGRVYGYCVLSVFIMHIFINIGMVLGLTPVIGIPLPFFSYGGSSLWGFTILLFIFLRIDAGRNLVRT